MTLVNNKQLEMMNGAIAGFESRDQKRELIIQELKEDCYDMEGEKNLIRH